MREIRMPMDGNRWPHPHLLSLPLRHTLGNVRLASEQERHSAPRRDHLLPQWRTGRTV